MSVAYAKERFTFGRAIGSYQAVKHRLTEVLRQLENGRSLLYYAGWARSGAPAEFPLAASAARSVAGRALDQAARTMISVHGGIGATWEHDAPLYFRRAQLSRRLLGGTAGATDRVAGELLAQPRPHSFSRPPGLADVRPLARAAARRCVRARPRLALAAARLAAAVRGPVRVRGPPARARRRRASTAPTSPSFRRRS